MGELLRSWKLSKVEQFSAPHGITVVFAKERDGTTLCVKHKPRGWSKEIEMTRMVQGHPNIVKFVAAKSLATDGPGIVLAEERLFHDQAMLCTGSPATCLQHVVTYVMHGLAALEHLASLHVVHCDISPSNIMYSRRRQVWCLFDFGSATEVSASRSSVCRREIHGTDSFIAPEALSGRTYSIASDLWSFGATAASVTKDAIGASFGWGTPDAGARVVIVGKIRTEIRRLMRDQPGIVQRHRMCARRLSRSSATWTDSSTLNLLRRSSRWTRARHLRLRLCEWRG
ncbi:kinase-like domain-containing protein [Entophlyctis helioformis]|nr:kinase-like domain-containing protein [Entophlyctis helioformis]